MDHNENKIKTTDKNELLKYEIADELGLSDKVRERGWKSLTAKESGRIGGIMRKRIRDAYRDEE